MLQWGHNRAHQVWQVGGGSSSLGMPCSGAPSLGVLGAVHCTVLRWHRAKVRPLCLHPRPCREGAPSPGSTYGRFEPCGSKASLLNPHNELDLIR